VGGQHRTGAGVVCTFCVGYCVLGSAVHFVSLRHYIWNAVASLDLAKHGMNAYKLQEARRVSGDTASGAKGGLSSHVQVDQYLITGQLQDIVISIFE
jgi:hypothetical protein